MDFLSAGTTKCGRCREVDASGGFDLILAKPTQFYCVLPMKLVSCFLKHNTVKPVLSGHPRGMLIQGVRLMFPASRGLSRRGKNERKERDLCRLPTCCLMKPPTRFLVETYRFLKPVTFNM